MIEKRKNIVGIDPGLTGAIAMLANNHELITVVDMPTMPLGRTGKRRQVDVMQLDKILYSFNIESPNGLHAIVEQVGAAPIQGRKQGGLSMFSFGTGYGMIQGVLAARKIPYSFALPQTWKRRAGLIGRDKSASIATAKLLYPQAPLTLRKHHGRADAILIAKFGGIN